MNLVATTLAGSDNTIHVIPNRQVWNATVLNFTLADTRRIDLEICIPHDANLQSVEQLLQTIVDGESRVQQDPAPYIHFGDENESAITFWVRVWVRTTDYDNVSTARKREISQGLRDAGIHTPYPRLQLTVNSPDDADATQSV